MKRSSLLFDSSGSFPFFLVHAPTSIMEDVRRDPQIALPLGVTSTSTAETGAATAHNTASLLPSPSTSFLALAASADQSPATTTASLDDYRSAASSTSSSKTLPLSAPVSVLSPHDFSRRRCSGSAGTGSSTSCSTTSAGAIDDPPTPRRAAPSPSPSPSLTPINRRFSRTTAARLSVDTFGGARTTGDSPHYEDECDSHKQADSRPRPPSTIPAEPKRNSLAPPSSIMFTPLSSSPVSPSTSSHSNSLRHATSSTNFKEEAQEYWAQKLSQRQDELATGASTTPSAVQMALSQSYPATAVTSDGSVVFTSQQQQHSPEMGSPISLSGNSFLIRQQQSSRRLAGTGLDSPMSSLHRSSTDGGMGEGGSSTSLNSSDLSRCSDSRPLLARERAAMMSDLPALRTAAAITPLQPLPATLNQLTTEERQALRRRNTKLVKLLGDEVLELHRERTGAGPSSTTPSHSPVKRTLASSRPQASLWTQDRAAAVNGPTPNHHWTSESNPSRPRHTRAESYAPQRTLFQDPDGTSSSDDDVAGKASMFEHDPYRQRHRPKHDTAHRRRTLSDNKDQQPGAHSSSSRSLTPLPDHITPKAAAMLGIEGSRRRPAPASHHSRQHSHSLTPLPDRITPKAALMLGIPTSEPAAPVARSSLSSSHEERRGSSSVQSHNTSSTGRSSLDILLSRVADEVPQALRPGVSTRRSSHGHGGALVSSPTRDRGNFSDDDAVDEEEQEIMYTADELESDSEGDGEVEVESLSSTPDFISDASDSSDFLSSSMLSASLDGNTTHDVTRRRDRRRRVEKMSRWLGSVVPAHIIAPDHPNDQPAYMSHEIPSSRRPGSAATSKSSRSSSIDSNNAVSTNVGLGIGVTQKKPKHSKKSSSSGIGSHFKQFI